MKRLSPNDSENRLRPMSLFRNMTTARIARRSAVLLSIVALGCPDTCIVTQIIDPCKGKDHRAQSELRNNLLSGSRWVLVSMDGAPIPPTGFVVTGFVERVYDGWLQFNTSDWWGDNACTDILESVGEVVGTYDVHAPGNATTYQTIGGRFHAEHEAGVVTFYAGDATKAAALSKEKAPTTRSITADVKIKKFGNRIFRLVFRENYR